MKRFDSSKWITKNKHGFYIEDTILTSITENYIEQNLPKGILLEKISDNYKLKVKNRLREIYHKNPKLLQEGIWDTLKNTFSKLGTLTKGGTWNPIKGRKLSKKANKEVEALIKKGSTSVIKDLDGELKEKYGEFPNMKSNEEFTQALEIISGHYESIANAIEQGDLEQGTGNQIILDLRKYLEKAIDYDLASVYRVFKEAEGDEEDALSGSRFSKTAGVFKSNKLPLALALTGFTTAGLAWLANSDWLANLLSKETVDITQSATELTANVEPGEGMSQLLNRVFDNVDLSPTSTGADFADAVQTAGGAEAMSGMFSQPDTAVNAINSIINNPDMANMPLKDIFVDELAGTGKTIGDQLVTVPGGTLKTTIINTVTKMVVTGTAKSAAIAAFGTSVLAPLGVSLMAAGALTKLARVKGMKSSRLSAMESVLNAMKFIDGPIDITDNPKPLPPVEVDDKCIVKYSNTSIVVNEIISIVIEKTKFGITFNDIDLENNEYLTNISTIQISEEKQLIEAVTLIIECLDGRKFVINSIEEYYEKREEIKVIFEKYKIKTTIVEEKEDKEKEDKEKEDDKKPVDPIGPASPEDPKTVVKKLKNVNRISQIAIVLKTLNPEANIYSMIRADKVAQTLVSKSHQEDDSSLTSTEVLRLAGMKGDSKPENEKLIELAKLIVALEKEKSENIRRMINKSFGKEILSTAAKAKQSSPGAARQSQFRAGVAGGTSLEEHLFLEYLNQIQEGVVTDLLPKFLTQDQINDKKVEALALLGSMYAAEGSTSDNILSTVDLKALKSVDPKAEKELKGMGFNPADLGLGKKYKFLGDVDRIRKKLSSETNLQQLLYKIDTKDELETFLIGLVKYIEGRFKGEKQKVKSTFFKIRNKLKEEEKEKEQPPDTKRVYSTIERNPALKDMLSKIDTVQEFEQLIAGALLPFTKIYAKWKGIGKDFKGKGVDNTAKAKIQSAIVAASNTFK